MGDPIVLGTAIVTNLVSSRYKDKKLGATNIWCRETDLILGLSKRDEKLV